MQLPIAKLMLSTLQTKQQQEYDNSIEFWFNSEFNKPIIVSLHIPVYAYLNQVVLSYINTVSGLINELPVFQMPKVLFSLTI